VSATAALVGVSKKYGRATAVHPTTLELWPGVVGLLGPNGAGKTTMLRLLSTALPPSTGRVIVAGFDATESHASRVEARRRLGYCPQEVTFPRGMTAFGFLDYVAVLKEWKDADARHAEVRRVLDLVHLSERTVMKVSRLSGGQRRRLAIAQALIGAPDLLILDEPTTGLDPEARLEVWQAIRDLATSGTTVLLTTQYLDEAEQLADRIAILHGGRIIENGTLAELKALLPPARVEYVEKQPTLEDVFLSLVGHDATRKDQP
jgi:ABC-2 type transport system ATP-binding protein